MSINLAMLIIDHEEALDRIAALEALIEAHNARVRADWPASWGECKSIYLIELPK